MISHNPCENKQNDETPQWPLNMMKQINTQLHIIQSQLDNQNKNLKTIENLNINKYWKETISVLKILKKCTIHREYTKNSWVTIYNK